MGKCRQVLITQSAFWKVLALFSRGGGTPKPLCWEPIWSVVRPPMSPCIAETLKWGWWLPWCYCEHRAYIPISYFLISQDLNWDSTKCTKWQGLPIYMRNTFTLEEILIMSGPEDSPEWVSGSRERNGEICGGQRQRMRPPRRSPCLASSAALLLESPC